MERIDITIPNTPQIDFSVSDSVEVTVDTAVTEWSENPVTSKGIKEYVDEGLSKKADISPTYGQVKLYEYAYPQNNKITVRGINVSFLNGERYQSADFPYLLSQLSNDCGYITKDELEEERKVKDYRNKSECNIAELIEGGDCVFGIVSEIQFNTAPIKFVDTEATPLDWDDPFECCITLSAGDDIQCLSNPSIFKFQGDDCDEDGYFTPVPNRKYELSVKKYGDIYSVRAGRIL